MNKKVIIIATSVILIAGSVSGFFYWRHYTSPEYSLLQVRNALNEHDLTKFEKYVDAEGVIHNFIDSLSEYEDKPDTQKTEMEKAGETLGKGLLAVMKPEMVKTFQQQIKKYVETGDMKSLYKKDDFSMSTFATKAGLENLEGIESTDVQGKIAYITLNINHKRYNQNVQFKIKMRNKENYWEIAEFANVPEFLKTLDELEDKKIAEVNNKVLKEMNDTIQVVDCNKSEYDNYDYSYQNVISRKVYISCNVFNRNDKDISDFSAIVKVSNKSGEDVTNLLFGNEKVVDAEEIKTLYWDIDINEYDKSHATLYKTPSDNLIYTINPESITFKDGKVLKLYQKYDQIPES